MFIMIVNHDVADYDNWKRVFDGFPPGVAGASFHHVNRSLDNPNNVTVVSGWESREAAEAFRNNPNLEQAMHEAGVTSAPRIELTEEVESVTY